MHKPALRLVRRLDGTLDDDLVVYLQQHCVPQFAQPRVTGHLHHGQRDDVRRRALDGRVDSRALRATTRARVFGGDVRQRTSPAQQRAHRTVAPRLLPHTLLPVAHLRSRVVPRLDSIFRLLHGHIPVLGQPMRCLAVRDGEVQRLGLAPLSAVLVLNQRRVWVAPCLLLEQARAVRDIILYERIHVHCGAAVEVPARSEGLLHGGAVRDVREDAELELAVVGDD
mmetsp:Transcript_4299/g.17283  ORF Transcript_4299/g.17283 Transcript_4299/m.17283 type:complete len:225 (-) Transcript_4299:629-1303(-)